VSVPVNLRSTANLTKALLFLLGHAALHGATYYVSTRGSDSGAGTERAPFRHLSKAAASAKNPGDTVVVMDGTYDNEGVIAPSFVVTLRHSGAPNRPITFQAQHRGQAILDSMNTSSTAVCNGAAAYFNLYNAAYIVLEGFVIQRGCDSGIQSNDNAHDITIRWNEIKNIANHTVPDQYGRDGIYLNRKEYNFIFDGNLFHDIGRTDGQLHLAFDHGIYGHASNITVINNVFYNMNRGWPIQLAEGASQWLVANNTFAFGSANGEPGHIMFWGSNSNIVIQNNIFYAPNGSALTRSGATISGSVFHHNLVYGVRNVMSGNTSDIAVSSNQMGVNPLFANATMPPYDFHLLPRSPAIRAGVATDATSDMEGRRRSQDSVVDLGAYAFSGGGTQ
jgi:hypothetical protein